MESMQNHVNQKILKVSLVSSLAGFLFGFDTVVISGAEKTLQELWNTSDWVHGFLVMSTALWGTVVGALFGSIPCDRMGRKKTLIWIGVLYIASALGSALANDPYTFSLFRCIGGLGIGVSTIAAPAYISEIAPKENRGKLVASYQFNIVLGILIAFLSNYLLKNVGEEPWRWMMGVSVVPATLYTLSMFTVPESFRWLITKKGKIVQAKKEYESYFGVQLTDVFIDDILRGNKEEKKESVFQRHYIKPLMLSFLIAFFNQASGINAFLYYAPRIFGVAGLENNSSFLSSIGIGCVNLLFTLIGVYLIDRMGRKKLMYIGSFGYIISLTLVAMAFFYEWQGMVVPLFLFLFIASHAVGQGAVIWVFIAEIFPNNVRAQGQSFGASTHWVMAALITLFMPVALSGFDNAGVIFLFFALMMFLQLLFVMFIMPETKGISLEEIASDMQKN